MNEEPKEARCCPKCHIGEMRLAHRVDEGGGGYVVLVCRWCGYEERYSRETTWLGY